MPHEDETNFEPESMYRVTAHTQYRSLDKKNGTAICEGRLRNERVGLRVERRTSRSLSRAERGATRRICSHGKLDETRTEKRRNTNKIRTVPVAAKRRTRRLDCAAAQPFVHSAGFPYGPFFFVSIFVSPTVLLIASNTRSYERVGLEIEGVHAAANL